MVGYQRNDSLTHSQKFAVGCFTGIITRLITQPVDIIKLRTQLQKRKHIKHLSMFQMSRKILREEGFKAFFHGHYIGQVHSILSVSTQFFIYELVSKQVVNSGIDEKHMPTMLFFSGIIAGCCSGAVALPLEVIRVRQMIAKEQYKGILNGAKAVYKAGGILAFYEGLSASLIQYGPAVGLSFSVFRFMQPLLLKKMAHRRDCDDALSTEYKPTHVVVASMIAGSTAGFISKTATYPLDLVKRRLQIGTHKEDDRFTTNVTSRHLIRCTKFLTCIQNIIKKEGFSGLFQGWLVTVLKSQLTSIVAFTTYECTCYVVREFNKSVR
ncbi:Mitochondrial thiamine pyrophosphate carrier [Papilio machaon]|uniref:Mitochondrial thiamine pyrophosphate carrier n=1 Tax=Papilio machaon TaxID=76193 RepID=A0A194QUA2_PAPMA|nr:Mitochondrial thiamine pyrophosphate carrier [Papilio machaon]